MNEEKLKELVFIALGETSVSSWSEEPKGVFRDDEVKKIGNKLVEQIITTTLESLNYHKCIGRIYNELENNQDNRLIWVSQMTKAYIDSERWYKQKTNKKSLNKKDKNIIANNAAEYSINLLLNL